MRRLEESRLRHSRAWDRPRRHRGSGRTYTRGLKHAALPVSFRQGHMHLDFVHCRRRGDRILQPPGTKDCPSPASATWRQVSAKCHWQDRKRGSHEHQFSGIRSAECCRFEPRCMFLLGGVRVTYAAATPLTGEYGCTAPTHCPSTVIAAPDGLAYMEGNEVGPQGVDGATALIAAATAGSRRPS